MATIIREVARRAGVSVATVSYVLNTHLLTFRRPSNPDGTNMWMHNPSNMVFGGMDLSWIDTFCATLKATDR